MKILRWQETWSVNCEAGEAWHIQPGGNKLLGHLAADF